MKRQSLIKGTIILGTAGIAAKFLGLFFRWPLQMLIGDEGVGYYQMSFPLYMFFIAAASGIPIAISKMVSERNAVNDRQGAVQVLSTAMILMLVMGMTFTACLLIFSRQIIGLLSWDEKSYYSLIGIAFAPIFISMMSALRGFFQGLQNMTYSAVSQLLEQAGRVVVGVSLAYILLPKGIEYSAGGAAVGASAGGVVGGVYLLIKYFRVKKEFRFLRKKTSHNILGQLLKIAVPVSIGAAVSTIMNLIDSIIVPQKLLEAGFTYKQSTILYGQLTGKAFILTNLPLTLSAALCASLIPIIAEAYILNKRIQVLKKVEMAMRISMVISMPSFLGLFFLSFPILNLIFPGQTAGYEILQYLSISIPFIILAQTSTAILQGIGVYSKPVINLALGCIIKVVVTLSLVPVPDINIYGAVIGTILGYFGASILNMRLLKKQLNITINFYNVILKPSFASLIMIIAVVLIYENVYNYTINSNISCITSILSGAFIYIILILIFGVFDYRYLKNRLWKKRRSELI